MAGQQIPWYVEIAKSWGVGTMFLIVLGVWAAPKIDRAFDTHMAVIPKIAETQSQQAHISEKQAEAIEKIGDTMQTLPQKIDDIHRAVVKPRDLVGAK